MSSELHINSSSNERFEIFRPTNSLVIRSPYDFILSVGEYKRIITSSYVSSSCNVNLLCTNFVLPGVRGSFEIMTSIVPLSPEGRQVTVALFNWGSCDVFIGKDFPLCLLTPLTIVPAIFSGDIFDFAQTRIQDRILIKAYHFEDSDVAVLIYTDLHGVILRKVDTYFDAFNQRPPTQSELTRWMTQLFEDFVDKYTRVERNNYFLRPHELFVVRLMAINVLEPSGTALSWICETNPLDSRTRFIGSASTLDASLLFLADRLQEVSQEICLIVKVAGRSLARRLTKLISLVCHPREELRRIIYGIQLHIPAGGIKFVPFTLMTARDDYLHSWAMADGLISHSLEN